MAVSVEAAELLEIFQWLTPKQSEVLPDDVLSHAKDEIGDILLCLLNLCNRLGVDPVQVTADKLEKVKLKYPVDKAKGLALKYSKL
ncbi:MAG: nucleotide pyrophosphohydrolase [Chitinophagaceae bacterium]|nr:nucleotide pyrophosphohydrolase [Oligoflexus sp.]